MHLQVFAPGEMCVQRWRLNQRTDAVKQRCSLRIQRPSEDGDGAAIGPLEAEYHSDCRRFASAVRPKKSVDALCWYV